MRPFLPMLLLLMVFSYPLAGCKKKGETGTDAALEADAESSSDDADKAGEKRKGKKSRKKGKKKGKKKDKKGKKKESSRKFYPGYILVRMELDDETWHIVNDTAKVTGFLGGKDKPAPISDAEAEQILKRMEEGQLKPQPKHSFEPGDAIRVKDGPFTNFNGTVEEVNPEKGKIKVLVSIFGRATPVELEFVQVTKI